MRKKLFITMSAIVALFFVGGIAEVLGWQKSCSTIPGNEWKNCSTWGDSVQANPGGTATVVVTGPASSTVDCDLRKAEAWLTSGTTAIQTATCPEGECTGGCSTAECCVTAAWTATLNAYYYVTAVQAVYTGSTCGPITGLIKNGTYTCWWNGPGGP